MSEQVGVAITRTIGPALDDGLTLTDCRVLIRSGDDVRYQKLAGAAATVSEIVPTLEYIEDTQYQYRLTFTPDVVGTWHWELDAFEQGLGLAYEQITVRTVPEILELPDSYPYADAESVSTYTGILESELPDDIDRLIARAADLVDYATLGQIDTDDEDHLAAAQKAVCALVEYWIEQGETAVEGGIKSKTVGKASITYAHSSTGGQRHEDLCDRAYQVLFAAGLMYRGAAVS